MGGGYSPSNGKRCEWCRQDKFQSDGRWDNGRWICYECYPNNTVLLDKAAKCCQCNHKSTHGVMHGNLFICSTCNPEFKKSGKKKKKNWHYECVSSSKKAKKERAKMRKNEELEAARREAERIADERRRTRWVVVITEISTGDL